MNDPKQPRADGDHRVGYRQPPVESQFKKDRSGNPKGRPRSDRKSISKSVTELIGQTITFQGRPKTYFDVLALRLKASALNGDVQAMEYLAMLTEDGVLIPGGRRITESELQAAIEEDAETRADELWKSRSDDAAEGAARFSEQIRRRQSSNNHWIRITDETS